MTIWQKTASKPQIPTGVLSVGAWSGAIDVNTYATVPVGATHVVIESDNASSASYAYGFRPDGSSTVEYAAASRFRRQDLVSLGGSNLINLFCGNLTSMKFFIPAYCSHPQFIGTPQDANSFATALGSNTYTIDCSSFLPSGAINGSVIVKINTAGTKTCSVAGVGNTEASKLFRHLPDNMQFAKLDANRKFEARFSAAIAAGDVTIVAWMAPGCYTEVTAPVAEPGTIGWSNLTATDTGEFAVMRTQVTSGSSQIYRLETGGTVAGSAAYFALTGGNPQLVVPTSNLVAQNSNATTTLFYHYGSIAANVSAASLSSINQLTEGASSTATFSASYTPTSFSLTDGTVTKVQSTTGGSGSSWTFNAPAITDGVQGLKPVNITITATDGSTTTNSVTQLYTKTGYTASNIVEVAPNNIGAIGTPFSPAVAIGDYFLCSAGTIDQYGVYTSPVGYTGTHTAWHYAVGDQIWRSFTITVEAGAVTGVKISTRGITSVHISSQKITSTLT